MLPVGDGATHSLEREKFFIRSEEFVVKLDALNELLKALAVNGGNGSDFIFLGEKSVAVVPSDRNLTSARVLLKGILGKLRTVRV